MFESINTALCGGMTGRFEHGSHSGVVASCGLLSHRSLDSHKCLIALARTGRAVNTATVRAVEALSSPHAARVAGDVVIAELGWLSWLSASLHDLDLRLGGPGDAAAAVLGEALKFNAVLNKLRLDDNKTGNEGAAAIGEALKVNAVLNSLDLGVN